jgi:Xaa-Pro dipeptidase
MERRDFLKTAAITAAAPLALSHALAQPGQSTNPKVKAIRDRIRPITKEERLGRLEKARRLMTELGIDALVMEGGTTLGYYTGVSWGRSERLFAMVLPRTGDPAYIAPKFEESRAREQVGTARLLTWEEDKSPYELVRTILQDNHAATGTVAIEETTRSFVTERIRKEIPGVTLTSGTPVTAGCRAVKSDAEVALMQVANDITKEVFLASLASLRDGLTEREFGATVSKLFTEYGVSGGALVLFGEASAHPHGLVKEHTLKSGDIVLIDGGCSVEGYASDVTRTTSFGPPSEKMRAVWSIVRKAQDAALAAARPGVPAERLDAAARAVIVEAGYGPDYKYFTHRLGHGIGLEGHEWYYLVRGNTRAELAGETHSNEPGIYIPGEFGVRLEDELLITPDGARLLLPQAPSLDQIF